MSSRSNCVLRQLLDSSRKEGVMTVYTAFVDYDPDVRPDVDLIVLSAPDEEMIGYRDEVELWVSLGEIPAEAAEADPWPRADKRYRGLVMLLDDADSTLADAGYVRVEKWSETGRGYVAAVERA
jgi:hypothetical protein